jgi:hypothetical protein
MRTIHGARWALCALASSICIPALADRAPRSLARCLSFEQSDGADDKVGFTIRNACAVPVDCSVSWRLVCAPASSARRSAHPGAASLAIGDGASQSTEASAARCGRDAWVIDSVRWSCRVHDD